MPFYSPSRLKICAAILLSFALASCNSSAEAPHSSGASADPPPATVSPETNSPARPSSKPVTGATKEPPLKEEPPQHQPDIQPSASAPTVETSTIQPQSKPPSKPTEPIFEPQSPSLASLKLGASEKEVVKHYGAPDDSYPLPGDSNTINIWEYDGLAIGLNERDKVVYIEITSNKVNTGVQGLSYGMDGTKAADLLGISAGAKTNVLALEVSGGWLKVDLDPDSRKVLSIKLLKDDI
ncbi:hypothetical protein [Cohnella terricola]|uniref:Uncharacterized protein n=1 Tax=Cohnella terricola TaxID=1289167 RepID=A0A559JW92_9BACL|nr:hypothetical protein [Cohnella terricola]TVY04153.1 hypothetical protein FPZ45_00685 [Cohnella terricola]